MEPIMKDATIATFNPFIKNNYFCHEVKGEFYEHMADTRILLEFVEKGEKEEDKENLFNALVFAKNSFKRNNSLYSFVERAKIFGVGQRVLELAKEYDEKTEEYFNNKI